MWLIALQFPDDIDIYFQKEIKHIVIVGPCEQIPFAVHYSSLLSSPEVGVHEGSFSILVHHMVVL